MITKIRMNKTLKLLGTYPMVTFHKGTTYRAIKATNQPKHEEKELYFVTKRNGESMLVSRAEKDFVIC